MTGTGTYKTEQKRGQQWYRKDDECFPLSIEKLVRGLDNRMIHETRDECDAHWRC